MTRLPVVIEEWTGLADCELMVHPGSGGVASVFSRAGIIRTFVGPDAEWKASGYARAYAEGRLR